MTMSIQHFVDSGQDNTVVYMNGHSNRRGTNEVLIKDGEISSVALKIEGVVHVMDSRSFYKFFDHGKLLDSTEALEEQFKTSPLPICVRYKSDNCIVVERPPFRVSPIIRYSRRSYRDSAKYVREPEIWIPWTVLVLTNERGFGNHESSTRAPVVPYLFFRNGPLSSFDDVLIPPYTPNIFNDCRVCMGDSENRLIQALERGDFKMSDINSLYTFIINEYFMGGWNMDLGHLMYHPYSEVFSKVGSAQNRPALLKLAESHKNRYLIRYMKKCPDLINPFTRSNEGSVKFYLNYMSCLNLDETLAHVEALIKKSSSVYNFYTNSKKTIQLGHVLSRHDPDFFIYRGNYQIRDVPDDSMYNDEADYLATYCATNWARTPNVDEFLTGLHTWFLMIEVDLKDFLSYASEKILNRFEDYKEVYFRGFQTNKRVHWTRNEFYKDSIATTLASDGMHYLVSDMLHRYFSRLKKNYDLGPLYNGIRSTMDNWGKFYRTEEGLATLKNYAVIKLSELNMVKRKDCSYEKQRV